MILTVASYKGGVGKTTTAVHLAAFLQELAPTCLLDGDATRSASRWAARAGGGLPFRVAPSAAAGAMSRQYEHLVMDTGQGHDEEALLDNAEFSDLTVVPAVPSMLDTDGLGDTVRTLQTKPSVKYCVLLTRVAPDALRQADELRKLLRELGAPVFAAQIPRLKAFEKAAGLGRTVDRTDDPNAARAWMAYEAAGKELPL